MFFKRENNTVALVQAVKKLIEKQDAQEKMINKLIDLHNTTAANYYDKICELLEVQTKQKNSKKHRGQRISILKVVEEDTEKKPKRRIHKAKK